MRRAQRKTRLTEAFAANMAVKPFKWEGQVVILLNLKVNNMVTNAVYDPGCDKVAVSQYFFKKMALTLNQVVLVTLSSHEGRTTINQSVFDLINIKWKATDVDLLSCYCMGMVLTSCLGIRGLKNPGRGLMPSAVS